MKLLHFLIMNMLFLASAVKVNVNNGKNDNDSNVRDKRYVDLALVVRNLLQNSQPTTKRPATPASTPPSPPFYPPPPGSQFVLPPFNYQPNPYFPNAPKNNGYYPNAPPNNGYVNFNVPDGYVLVTPPPLPPAPKPATIQTPLQTKITLKQQQKQNLFNILAAFSGYQAPTTKPSPPPPLPPQAILIPTQLLPGYQQQLRDRAVYKYVQHEDTSSEAQYPYATDGRGPTSAEENYYYESPVRSSSYHPSTHQTAYEEQKQSTSSPDRFRITYTDDDDYYQTHKKTTETQSQHHEESQEHGQEQEHEYEAQEEPNYRNEYASPSDY